MSVPTKVYVFDLDGVLYRGEAAVEDAADALARLRARTPAPLIYFLTNNSSQPRSVYREKLERLGMPCADEEIVTSSSATAVYLTEILEARPDSVVLAVGGPGIAHEMGEVGLTVIHSKDCDPETVTADFVVAGMDRNFNYHTLHVAQQAILRGATFVATNRDGQYPVEEGKVTPGGGAIVAAIEASTDTTPAVIGKPEPLGLQTIIRRSGVQPEEALMIGDRLDTDILCGNRLGVPTALVLTGVTSESKALAAPPEMTPGRILKTLADLT